MRIVSGCARLPTNKSPAGIALAGGTTLLFLSEGRKVCIRCSCKLNGHVLRKQTLRATTQFFQGASAAKVCSEPIL